MRRFIGTMAFLLLLAGCAKRVEIPVYGDANFSECQKGDCSTKLGFAPDSILSIENAKECKVIFYEGKFFLIGDGFSNIWLGENEDNKIEFTPKKIENSPVSNISMDWDRGFLVISGKYADGKDFRIVVDKKGKLNWE